MKGFTRNSKPEQDVASPNPAEPAASFSRTRSGLLVILAGLAVAAALVWLGLPPPSQKEYRAQLAQALAAGQGASLRQAIHQLAADTQAAARAPLVLRALQSQDRAQLPLAQESLRASDNLVDVHVNLRGQAEQSAELPAPMTFTALELVRRAEAGENPPMEATHVGQRWLLYSAAAVRSPSDQAVLGSVVLVFDLQRLLGALASMPANAGQLSLQQHFANAPTQMLYQVGTPAPLPSLDLEVGNPNWSLTFTPGSEYQTGLPWVSIALMLLAALAVLVAAWVALTLTANRLHQQVAADARQLEQLIEELSGGKAVKAFGLRLAPLTALAVSLARFSLRGTPTAAADSLAATRRALPGSGPARFGVGADELSDPLFQNVDILDDMDEELPSDATSPIDDTARLPPSVPVSIFRAYDIRGVVGKTLNPETAYWIGRAIGAQSLAQNEPNIAVGRDGRLSGPALVGQLIQGLADAGCHVSNIGLVPTPALYYATHALAGRSGVMLTGSHNPPDYNGFKVVIAGDTLANEQILALHQRLANNDLSRGHGSVVQVEILERYYEEIVRDVILARRLKVVLDCGNGAAAVIAPRLIAALDCEVIPLFCEVDGHFPNHHPDPGKPENLLDLIAKVRETGADLGLAFDGDGDRVGVVTNAGTIIWPDRLLMLFAQDVVSRNPGADIIFDVKCTRRLGPLITRHGGRPVMWKTGHSLIKKHMRATGALLAGEMSGHIFFKERWFGFDDGIYAAARLLELLSQQKRSAEEVFAAFANDICTPEINIQVTDERKFTIIEALERTAQWGEAQLTTIDGLRVDYPTGWGLVRASNTTPVLVLRFEADSQAELERLQQLFRLQLAAVAPDLHLPF